MALLFDEDYIELKARGLTFVEDEGQRFFIFTGYPLPPGLYNLEVTDVLVQIPSNYNAAGNDMFWTYPLPYRVDGKTIPAVSEPAVGGDNRHWNGKEFCRWSRHWNPPSPGVWRPGKDNIISIERRIDWAFRNPDAQ